MRTKEHFLFPLCLISCKTSAGYVYQFNILRNNKPHSESTDLQYKLYLYCLKFCDANCLCAPVEKTRVQLALASFLIKRAQEKNSLFLDHYSLIDNRGINSDCATLSVSFIPSFFFNYLAKTLLSFIFNTRFSLSLSAPHWRFLALFFLAFAHPSQTIHPLSSSILDFGSV